MILYYKVYLETRRRQKELRKLQDGQQVCILGVEKCLAFFELN